MTTGILLLKKSAMVLNNHNEMDLNEERENTLPKRNDMTRRISEIG